jgi:hypothetical protein
MFTLGLGIISESPLPDAAQRNNVKQLDRCNRGNSKCKYMLFLIQILMQMYSDWSERYDGGESPFSCQTRLSHAITLPTNLTASRGLLQATIS